jgi:Flp pilus assembly protein TadG
MKEKRGQRGQELAELGMVITVFIVLVGGVMQFGHAFMVANMITHAARDGARLAASWASRGLCGQITNSTDIQTAVKNRIQTVTSQTFTVTVSQSPAVSAGAAPPNCPASGTTPTVKVNVNGCVPYIFNIPGFSTPECTGGFKVNRDVTFDDELRATFGG